LRAIGHDIARPLEHEILTGSDRIVVRLAGCRFGIAAEGPQLPPAAVHEFLDSFWARLRPARAISSHADILLASETFTVAAGRRLGG
jgi:hypothetical protein